MSQTTAKRKAQPRPFRLKKPCHHCPFRSDVPKYIRPERAQEIAESLYAGAEFPCHQTTEHVEHEDGSGETVATKRSAFCAGALITMEREGYSNQMVRVGERLGLHDHERLDMDAPVYDSLTEWVRSYRVIPTVTTDYGEVLELEHCGVVAEDCEDPAGYSMGGGAVENLDEPTCDPTKGCSSCGATMCIACTAEDLNESGYPICVYCAETPEYPEDEESDD